MDFPELLLWPAGLCNTVTAKEAEKGPSWWLPKIFKVTSCPGGFLRLRDILTTVQGGFPRGPGVVHRRSWGTGTHRESPREWPGLGARERGGTMWNKKSSG